MNMKYLYLALAVVLVGVVLFLAFDQDTSAPADAAAGLPEGHPEMGARQDGAPDAEGPTASNVREDYYQRVDNLKAKVEKDPSDLESALELARLLRDGHRAEESIKYFDLYLKANPNSVNAMLDLSVSHFMIGNRDEAMKLTQKILSIDPKNATAMYNLGALYASQEKFDKAREVWKDLIAAHPEDENSIRAKEALERLK
ncbi:MAG: tetratricopeptide repeat protein [Chlorobi bacterium]|nr:tetratricopeptide repeat protein [Chlorobiota bacterium]